MHKLSRFTPFALLRRYLALREAELALRVARLADAERRTAGAIGTLWDEAFQAGRVHERQLLGAAS